MTVLKAFQDFIRSRKLAGLSNKTIVCYNSFVRSFVEYIGQDLDISLMMRDSIDSYIEMLYDKDTSRATVATYLRHIKTFLRWLESEYDVSYNAKSIRIPKTPKKMLRIYNDDEIIEIFQTVQKDKSWLGIRNSAIIALMLDSGLRQGEVCGLMRKDIYFKDNMIKICGKGNKERVVPIGSLTAHYLQEYFVVCPYPVNYAFASKNGDILTCDAVKHIMYKLSQALPFEFSSHKLRHNFATNYCMNQYAKSGQVDIYRLMILLGHSEVETTRRYLHMANRIIASQTTISHIDKILLGKN